MDQREYRYNSYQSRPSGSGCSDYPQHGTRQKTGKVLLRRQLRQLRRVLTENDLLCARETPGKITLETSGAPETVLPIMRRLLVRADTM